MKKTIIILLFLAGSLTGQNDLIRFYKNNPDAAHAHGSIVLNCSFYQAQKVIFPKQRDFIRVLISNALTAGACYVKEIWDNNRPNGTGFSKPDLFIGLFQIPSFDILHIAVKDQKKQNKEKRKLKQLKNGVY